MKRPNIVYGVKKAFWSVYAKELEQYADQLEFHLNESQSEVSTQAIIIKKLEKQKAELLHALKEISRIMQSDLLGEGGDIITICEEAIKKNEKTKK